jgi:hypothetical protein
MVNKQQYILNKYFCEIRCSSDDCEHCPYLDYVNYIIENNISPFVIPDSIRYADGRRYEVDLGIN